MTLTEFLLERIAEKERIARLVTASSIGEQSILLAECEAQRRIVEIPETEPMDDPRWKGYHLGWRHMHTQVLLRLALPYADHPDFREQWRS